ncbi:hypothetical protein ACOSQ4_026254 [Xanthoceras sorbifolium]
MYGGDEVSAIVLDLGSHTCKAGYAGEDAPKAVFPSVVGAFDQMDVDDSENAERNSGSGIDATNNVDSNKGKGKRKLYVGTQALGFHRDHMEVLSPLKDGVVADWDLVDSIWDYAFRTIFKHSVTERKVKLSEKTSLLETAEGKIAELTAKVNEQQKLIQKLEDDISKGYGSKDWKGNLFDDWDLSEGGKAEVSEKTDQKHVICNQRDRFRTHLRETEEEIRQLKEKIGDYNQEKVVSRGSKKYAEDLESGFHSDIEWKYKKIYEDDINPFAAFSKKERDQRYKELGFRDRITLSSGRFLLGNKYAQTFAFFYTIGLHILVFTCLYRMSALSYLSNGPEDFLDEKKIMNLPHAL